MTRRGPLPAQRLDEAVAGLKKFQHRTAAAVIEALFERGRRRFLVADEVGLGKTKIAKAVIAETVRRLWDDEGIDRIDVVYICSNTQIARQNIEDLDVLGTTAVRHVDRITMLPTALAKLTDVNVVAFTPDTSLNMGNATGRVGERAMLFDLLRQPAVGWGSLLRRERVRLMFAGVPGLGGLERELERLRSGGYTAPERVAKLLSHKLRKAGSAERLHHLADGRRARDLDGERALVAELRRLLAQVCIEVLTPDLVILDEFQRFTDLLDPDTEEGRLAHEMFDHPTAKVLLLSATPYKTLTSAHDDESHFKGFDTTFGFLLGDDRKDEMAELRTALTALRNEMAGARDVARLTSARIRIEMTLRSVMVRTERLAATADRGGMLTARDAGCSVTKSDVAGYVATDEVASLLDRVPDMVEYWKSAPYLFNFMDNYAAKRALDKQWLTSDTLAGALTGAHVLTWPQVNRYRRVDPLNGRLRWLLEDLNRDKMFDRLWVPPSLAQTELFGAYASSGTATKRLIFSGWAVVPKSVSGLVSYEFERRHRGHGSNYETARGHTSPLTLPALSSRSASERFTTLALFLPCLTLARLGDPLRVAASSGTALPVPLSTMRAQVRSEVAALLAPLVAKSRASGTARNIWYVVALAYLDPAIVEMSASNWLPRSDDNARRTHMQGLSDHLERLREAFAQTLGDEMPDEWGRPPDDLAEVLAEIAIGGPSVAVARSLRRISGQFPAVDDTQLRTAAARVGWSFTSVFNTFEAQDIVMRSSPAGDYWRRLLAHCVEGGLGSVLDEWMHLIPDQRRLGASSEAPLDAIVDTAQRVLRLADGAVSADFYDSMTGVYTRNLRTHFAMRYGQARGTTAEGENPLDVRFAFNSPFRPFVLVSTSVGQEGLDFHHYARTVVHWNLPNSPVDLEQREGRVHRYKNHAVRHNIAAQYLGDPRLLGSLDPWATLFELADDGAGGMRPQWIFGGESAIERVVPLLPMSRDVRRLADLVEATSLYRMTLGQPRQAELMQVLAGLTDAEQAAIRDAVTIDLAPKESPEHPSL